MTTNRNEILKACSRIATSQYGLITAEQAKKCGFSPYAIRRRQSSGRWRRVFPGVFLAFDNGDRWKQNVIAVDLWLGDDGAISHRAAGAWWELDGCSRGRVEATSIGRKALSGVPDRGMTNGIWVTSPTRTIVDVAAVVDYDVLEAATFCALRRRLTTGDKIAAALTRSAPMPGRPGGAAIRDLLSDLDVNGSETGSYLETRFWQWIRKTGLPLPRRQFVIRDGGRYIGRVDFAYPAQRFAIEVQSYEFHGTSRSFQEDQARLNDLHDCGWQGRLVTKTDLDDPRQLFDELSRRLGVQSLFVP